MSDDEWQSLGAIAARMMEKMAAPAGEVKPTGAGALATVGSRAQHHDVPPRGGAGAVVIWVNFSNRSGGEAGHKPPPHHSVSLGSTNRMRDDGEGRPATAILDPLAKRPARLPG